MTKPKIPAKPKPKPKRLSKEAAIGVEVVVKLTELMVANAAMTKEAADLRKIAEQSVTESAKAEAELAALKKSMAEVCNQKHVLEAKLKIYKDENDQMHRALRGKANVPELQENIEGEIRRLETFVQKLRDGSIQSDLGTLAMAQECLTLLRGELKKILTVKT